MKVPFKTSAALGLCIPSIDTALFVESIALIPASSMLRPWSHAHPAKLPFTFLACHVTVIHQPSSSIAVVDSLATAVLLNGRLALCAFLGVRLQPICRFRIIRTFLLPELDHLAQNRPVTICIPASAILVTEGDPEGHLPEA